MRGHSNNNLDLMRLVFAAMVIVAHAYELTTGRPTEPLVRLFGTLTLGDLGVDCFFILSGFLISESWRRRPEWGAYLAKRIRRIFPGYLVAFMISAFVVGAIGASDPQAYLAALDPAKLTWNALTLHVPQTPPTFAGLVNPVVNASMWTLPFEFACYVALMLAGMAGLLRKQLVAPCFAILLVCTAILEIRTNAIGPTYAVARFAVMFGGGVVARLYRFQDHRSGGVAAVCTVALLAAFSVPWLVSPAVAVCGAYLLIYAGYSRPIPNRLPDVSYGIYLYGWPVELLLIHFGIRAPVAIWTIALVICVACGWASWTLVERRFVEWRPERVLARA